MVLMLLLKTWRMDHESGDAVWFGSQLVAYAGDCSIVAYVVSELAPHPSDREDTSLPYSVCVCVFLRVL